MTRERRVWLLCTVIGGIVLVVLLVNANGLYR